LNYSWILDQLNYFWLSDWKNTAKNPLPVLFNSFLTFPFLFVCQNRLIVTRKITNQKVFERNDSIDNDLNRKVENLNKKISDNCSFWAEMTQTYGLLFFLKFNKLFKELHPNYWTYESIKKSISILFIIVRKFIYFEWHVEQLFEKMKAT
jgi:hypothetical protein